MLYSRHHAYNIFCKTVCLIINLSAQQVRINLTLNKVMFKVVFVYLVSSKFSLSTVHLIVHGMCIVCLSYMPQNFNPVVESYYMAPLRRATED